MRGAQAHLGSLNRSEPIERGLFGVDFSENPNRISMCLIAVATLVDRTDCSPSPAFIVLAYIYSHVSEQPNNHCFVSSE